MVFINMDLKDDSILSASLENALSCITIRHITKYKGAAAALVCCILLSISVLQSKNVEIQYLIYVMAKCFSGFV